MCCYSQYNKFSHVFVPSMFQDSIYIKRYSIIHRSIISKIVLLSILYIFILVNIYFYPISFFPFISSLRFLDPAESSSFFGSESI